MSDEHPAPALEPAPAPAPGLAPAVAEFRGIFKRLEAEAGARDLSGEHPFGFLRDLAAAGFGRLRVPVELGGFGVDVPTLFGLLAEAGAADSNIPQILRGGTDEAYTANYIDVSAAQSTIIEAVLDAATIAFNAGGSSSVREGVHLDRHWRNARTLASHNPVVYKPRIVGDFLVNGASPASWYDEGRRSRPEEP